MTPLARLHPFNGWADAFTTNGGPGGLQDLFLEICPALPWGLDGAVVLHRFYSDHGGHHLGDELDAVLTYRVNRFLLLRTKGGVLEGDASHGPADRYRFWVEMEINI